jgi:ATP-binding cassette subfamily G (WHITE) protein 2 (SNQ2)
MLWGSNLVSPQERDGRRNPWHEDEYLQNGRERTERPELHSEDSNDNSPDGLGRSAGTWGERDAGHLNTRTAAEDLHILREELATLSKTRSQGTQPERIDGLFRTLSKRSTRHSAPRRPSTGNRRRTSVAPSHDGLDDKEDVEPGDIGAAAAEEEDDFELDQFMREGYFEKRKDGVSAKKVGVTYKGLTVKGIGSTASFVRTLPDAVLGTFGPDLYHLISGWVPALRLGRHSQTRTLIYDFSGVVKDGEMMLVLGR